MVLQRADCSIRQLDFMEATAKRASAAILATKQGDVLITWQGLRDMDGHRRVPAVRLTRAPICLTSCAATDLARCSGYRADLPWNLPRAGGRRSQAYEINTESQSNGITRSRPHRRCDRDYSASCHLPPLAEQRAIADFLDRETAGRRVGSEAGAADRPATRRTRRAHHPRRYAEASIRTSRCGTPASSGWGRFRRIGMPTAAQVDRGD